MFADELESIDKLKRLGVDSGGSYVARSTPAALDDLLFQEAEDPLEGWDGYGPRTSQKKIGYSSVFKFYDTGRVHTGTCELRRRKANP